MTTVTVRAPAKINLGLSVGPPRPDGFHPLATVYQAISIYDEIKARPAAPGDFTVTLTGEGDNVVPMDGTNLAVQAARLLAKHLDVDEGAALSLHKMIAVSGGLAGGSADAAGALLACDALWGAGVSRDELMVLAAQLGSDVPFCLVGGNAIGTGRGDSISPVLARGSYEWVLAYADGGLSTPQVFAEFDRFAGRRVGGDGGGDGVDGDGASGDRASGDRPSGVGAPGSRARGDGVSGVGATGGATSGAGGPVTAAGGSGVRAAAGSAKATRRRKAGQLGGAGEPPRLVEVGQVAPSADDAGRERRAGPDEPDVSPELMAGLRCGDPYAVGLALHNDLQAAALRLQPGLRNTLSVGEEFGALGSLVSGSGPTCLFLAADEDHAVDLAVALSGSGTCRIVQRATGPVHGARVIA